MFVLTKDYQKWQQFRRSSESGRSHRSRLQRCNELTLFTQTKKIVIVKKEEKNSGRKKHDFVGR